VSVSVTGFIILVCDVGYRSVEVQSVTLLVVYQ
jgi:hypothetical protein